MSTVHCSIVPLAHVSLGTAPPSALQTGVWTSPLGPLLPSASLGIQSNQSPSPADCLHDSLSNSIISRPDDCDSRLGMSPLLAPASQSLPHPVKLCHLIPAHNSIALSFSSHCWHFKLQQYQTAFILLIASCLCTYCFLFV